MTLLLLPPVYQILHQRTRELEMVQLSEVMTEDRKFQGHLLRLIKSSDKSRARRTSIWNGPRLRITENLQAHRRHTSLLPRRQLGLVTFTDIPQTNSNIVGRRTLCKPGSRNAVGEIIFILLSSESKPLEMLFCGAFIPDYLRILGAKKSACLQWLLLKVRTYVFAELARNSNIPKITTPQG